MDPDDYEQFDSDEDTRRRHKVTTINSYVETIRDRDPQSIENLDLGLFAQEIERTQGKKIKFKLQKIKDEVKKYYKDARPPFKDLQDPSNTHCDDLFELLTGESERSLMTGQKLTCKVVHIRGFGINCVLETRLCVGFLLKIF